MLKDSALLYHEPLKKIVLNWKPKFVSELETKILFFKKMELDIVSLETNTMNVSH